MLIPTEPRSVMPLDVALVLLYLRRLKELINQGHIYFWGRGKNLECLARLGLTHQHRNEILLSLQPRNFSQTLDPEPGQAVGCWVFGVREQEVEIYIKVKIVDAGPENERAVCVSFHEADRPLTYPFNR